MPSQGPTCDTLTHYLLTKDINTSVCQSFYLELPLGGHHLGIGTGDVDAGVHAGAVVGLNDVAAVDLVGPHAAVVGPLGPGEAVLGPAERVLVLVQEGVLLLDAEPRLLVLGPGR